jgi:hypothetical protein
MILAPCRDTCCSPSFVQPLNTIMLRPYRLHFARPLYLIGGLGILDSSLFDVCGFHTARLESDFRVVRKTALTQLGPNCFNFCFFASKRLHRALRFVGTLGTKLSLTFHQHAAQWVNRKITCRLCFLQCLT